MSNRLLQSMFCHYADDLLSKPQPLKNIKAIEAITRCRTEALGVSYFSCNQRHTLITRQHSCRHRGCYLCAQKQRRDWIEARKVSLLNCAHFHVVFTLPHDYLALWRYNEALFSRLLFSASHETLMTLMRDPRHHGVTPGILIALHTWGRQLTLHPHTHCLVTAGGLDTQQQWRATGDYLLPIRAVKALYRGKIQHALQTAFACGDLTLPPDMTAAQFRALHRALYRKTWSVRIEERYAHGRGVLIYLARYFKGGPLHPQQISEWSPDVVAFRYRDHRDGRTKILRLQPLEFLQRLLTHVPTPGLHTVRHYGLYAGCSRRKHLLRVSPTERPATACPARSVPPTTVLLCCPQCHEPVRRIHAYWPSRSKGISIYKERPHPHVSASGFVQHVDHADVANVPSAISSGRRRGRFFVAHATQHI